MQLNASNIHAAILQYLKDQKVILEHEVQLTEPHISQFIGQVAYTYNLTGEHVRAAIGTVGMFPEELIDHLESILDRVETSVEEALGIEPEVETAQPYPVEDTGGSAEPGPAVTTQDAAEVTTVQELVEPVTEDAVQPKPRTSKKKVAE